MSSLDPSQKSLWAAIIAIGSLTLALATTSLFWSTGTQLSGALGAGGATFLGAATLGINVRRFLSD